MAQARERTFIMVKPDGVHRGLVGEIIKRFEQRGYKLVGIKTVQVSIYLCNEILILPFYLHANLLPTLWKMPPQRSGNSAAWLPPHATPVISTVTLKMRKQLTARLETKESSPLDRHWGFKWQTGNGHTSMISWLMFMSLSDVFPVVPFYLLWSRNNWLIFTFWCFRPARSISRSTTATWLESHSSTDLYPTCPLDQLSPW